MVNHDRQVVRPVILLVIMLLRLVSIGYRPVGGAMSIAPSRRTTYGGEITDADDVESH